MGGALWARIHNTPAVPTSSISILNGACIVFWIFDNMFRSSGHICLRLCTHAYGVNLCNDVTPHVTCAQGCSDRGSVGARRYWCAAVPARTCRG
jgi:hypothetical protein